MSGVELAESIRERALWIRRRALRMVFEAKLGHPGGDLSAADILATLYFGVLRYDTTQPDDQRRDRFVMSKGHCSGVLYATLCASGYFTEDWLDTYMQPESKLNGHPNRNHVPGVETNTGPLGHGFPVATGMALAGKLSAADFRTYVLTGDGELQEGSNWEAAMVAGHQHLSHLTLIVDRNHLQQGASTEETVNMAPLDARFESFGWHVEKVDGHDVNALLQVLGNPVGERLRPLCVIAETTKGKGVSYMENNVAWHHGVPNQEQFDIALQELCPDE